MKEKALYTITKYPDGTSYVCLSKEAMHYEHLSITFRINTYEDLWHLNQLCEVISYNNKHAIITIPNLIDGQADRRFKNNQNTSLSLIAELLNEYSPNIGFNIFHPHNPEVTEALFHCVEITDNSEFVQHVLDEIYLEDYTKKLVLMSSDAGGFKPLMKLCDKIGWQGETYSASKARSWDEEEGTKFVQQIDKQDFEGKDILIVDDISVYGGTFKGLAKLLREKNCGNLYLAVSHMTTQNLGEDPVTNHFDHVFTTNSKYPFYSIAKDKIEGKVAIFKSPNNLTVVPLFDD